jgi:hypothetical protein
MVLYPVLQPPSLAVGSALERKFARRATVVPPVTGMALGVNLGAAGTGNAVYPFINVLWNSGPWAARGTNTGTFTQNQGDLVATVATDFFYLYLSDAGRGLPQGRYTVLNPNGCKLGFGAFTEYVNPRFTFAEPNDDGAGYFTLTEFQFDWPGAHPIGTGLYMMAQGSVSGVKVIMPNQRPNWDAGERFSPEFIAYEQGLGATPLRMMLWNGTNVTIDADESDRTTTTHMTFLNDADTRSVPWEVQAAAANKCGKDLWVNVPVTATEAYVTAMATVFKNLLNPSLKVYVELGNEIWNNFNEIARATAWVRYLTHTKIRATVDSATGEVTTVNPHNLGADARLQCFSTRVDRQAGINDSDGPSGYMTARGSDPLYAEILTPNKFKLWTKPIGDANRAAAPWAPGRTTVDYLVFAEAGKDTSTGAIDTNYADLTLRNAQLFDAVFGDPSRVKIVMAGQAANTTYSTGRLAHAAAVARTDCFAIAPYYTGVVFAMQAVITSGQILPQAWTNAGGTDRGAWCTQAWGVYALGSTPRDDEVIAGTGAGFVAKSTWSHREDGRFDAPVTISVGTPAVIDWAGAPAPANGRKVRLFTTGALPTGLTASNSALDASSRERLAPATTYFVVNSSGSTCNLAATLGGAAIATTAAGSGTHTADTFEESTVAYVPGPAMTVPNGTYRCIELVTDPDGFTWRMEQDITVDVAGSTVNIFDSYANQAKRDTITILNRTGPWITAHKNLIAGSAKPSIQLVNYEGGSHWFFVENNVPPLFYAWMFDGYVESQEYADSQARYFNYLAAQGVKVHEIFTDLSDKSVSWTLANNYTDTLDKRYLMAAGFNGAVPITTPVSVADAVGTAFPNQPGSFPQTVHTFADPTLTYTILKETGSRGNYQIVGNELRMVAGNGIDWLAPTNQTVTILATNGTTEDLFDVTSSTGSAWYEGDALYALDMTHAVQTANLLDAIIGGNLVPTTTPGTLAGGLLNMTGGSNYTSTTALISNLTVDNTQSTLAVVVLAQGGLAATSQSLLQFGSSQFLRLSTSTTNANQVRWRMLGGAGGADTSFPTQVWDATPRVFWIFLDPANSKAYAGRNQSTEIDQAHTNWTNNTFVRELQVRANSNPKFGSIEVVQRAGLTLAEALAMVQKVQTLHGIA